MKELTKNRRISWKNWQRTVRFCETTGKSRWFSGRLFDLFDILGTMVMYPNRIFDFPLRIMVMNLKNQPDTWLGVWCNSNAQSNNGHCPPTQTSFVGKLLNFEVTIGLGRLLQKRKRTAQPWNFKLPWAQRPKGTKKTWT